MVRVGDFRVFGFLGDTFLRGGRWWVVVYVVGCCICS